MISESCVGLGSFSQDPIGFAGGMNFYRSLRNSPLLLVDALGAVESTVRGVGEAGNCGVVSLDWNVRAGDSERFVVQRICFGFNVTYCGKKDGCYKGVLRDACKICYYELLLDRLRSEGERNLSIDEWRYAPARPTKPVEAQCGTRGTITISSEVRGFGWDANVSLGERGGQKKFYKCDNNSIQGSSESSDDTNVPDWWNSSNSSIFTFATMTWDCCKNPHQRGRFGTSED